MLIFVPRKETGLPVFPDSHYDGPFQKIGVCIHHMGAHENVPVSISRMREITRANYNTHLKRWHAIDIIEGYDFYLGSDGNNYLFECRPWWSNCDAFSGAKKLGHSYIGIEVCGNWHKEEPSERLVNGIAEAIYSLWLQGKFAQPSNVDIKGHRDFNHLSSFGPSECPGDKLYAKLPEIRDKFQKLTKKEEEEEMMINFVLRINPDGTIFKEKDGRMVWDCADCLPWKNNWLNVRNPNPTEVEVEIFYGVGPMASFTRKIEPYGKLSMMVNEFVRKFQTCSLEVKCAKYVVPVLTIL